VSREAGYRCRFQRSTQLSLQLIDISISNQPRGFFLSFPSLSFAMIPALNMTKLHCSSPGNNVGGSGGTAVGQGSVSRLHTSRQMSPRTPNVISPRDANSSQSSAHLTRRAAEVAPMLEMNPLQCQNIGELQRKLIETAEWIVKLHSYYVVQLQERDAWMDGRLRDLEKFCIDAVSAAVESRVAAAAAAAATTTSGVNSSNVDNGAPATISTAKVGLACVPHNSICEAKTAESEKGCSVTPPRRRGSKHQSKADEPSTLSSVANSPQPSLPSNAQADTTSLVDAADNGISSAGRSRANQPKKSAVIRIPQSCRTVSASGVRRHTLRQDDSGSPRLGGTLQSTVDRGEARPTRAARPIADKTCADNTQNNSTDGGATRRRYPPALAASRGTTSSGFVDSTGGPRLNVLAATVPATMRLGKGTVLDTLSSNNLSMSTGGEVDRRRSESNNSRRRCYTSSPRAVSTDLSATAPPHSHYLEAGAGLMREGNGGTGTASRENNAPNTSVGSLAESSQNRTPRDGGSTFFYLLGSSGGGTRPVRPYNTGASSQASQRSASHGVSGRGKRKGRGSGNVSSQSSPARVHAL
jgi:hypothetical protein